MLKTLNPVAEYETYANFPEIAILFAPGVLSFPIINGFKGLEMFAMTKPLETEAI